VQTNKAVMTGADGNQMDTESFLASLSRIDNNDIKDRDGNTIVAAGKEVPFSLLLNNMVKVSLLVQIIN
jgi:hypothetical protein